MYEVPLDPVTWIEAALVSVTVRVSVCPDVMLLELAVIETVGTDAAALAANAEIATKVRRCARDGKVFTGACLDLRFYELAWNVSGGESQIFPSRSMQGKAQEVGGRRQFQFWSSAICPSHTERRSVLCPVEQYVWEGNFGTIDQPVFMRKQE